MQFKTRKFNTSTRTIATLGFLLSSTVLSACGGGSGSSGSAISSSSQNASGTADMGYTCTFTEVGQLTTDQNTGQDFTTSNATYGTSVENSTCTEISLTPSSPVTVSASRSGGLITVGNSSGTDTITITNNQATIPQSDLSSCSNSIQGTGTLSGVTIDPATGSIILYINWSMIVNGCTQSTPGSGQSAPASVYTYS